MVIYLVGVLSYSVRIAGVRTGKIAVSLALFGIMMLVSRTSNSFLGPLLAKRLESGFSLDLLTDLRIVVGVSSAAVLLGFLLTPTAQRVFSRAIIDFQSHRSIPRLIYRGLFKGGVTYSFNVAVLPGHNNLKGLINHGVSIRVIALNVMATALWTIGVLASIYAGALNPELRVTSSTLSSVINGGATIVMAVFIDPYISVVTEDAVEGRMSQGQFRRVIICLMVSRFVGTLVAQVFFVPAAYLISLVANVI
ncbi:lipid II flippase Amj family protein [Pseudomonas aeruginosa]|uniref:lipid II flippase Amj family protein n=1 Tax=Pseudomonas aeruginosa TaxID=287 RepID=UPI0039F4D6F7